MSFEANIDQHIATVQRYLNRVRRQMREYREEVLEIDLHESCCEDCPHKAEAEEAWDEAQASLEDTDEWQELVEEEKAYEIELIKLKNYKKRVTKVQA